MMNEIAEFLNIVIFQNSWIYINLWMFVHSASGFLLMKYFVKRNNFSYLLLLLIGYEFLELIVISTGSTFFRPEIPLDVFYDIIFGFGGAVLYKWIKK